MTDTETSWRALFQQGGIVTAIFIGGVALQAIESFIGSAMLPTVVRDIGGLDLFAWNTTLFIVASIGATVFAATRPAAIGPRDMYVIAAGAFGLGSLVCGLAPSMAVLLLGRTVQGFGAGLIIATSLAMIRIVFPQPLWPRAMSLNALVWGVATLLGPAIGGVFAQYGLWRWAFLSIVPLAALLALGAWRILPAREAAATQRPGAPILQIGLVIAAILLVSIASLLTDNVGLAAILLLAAMLTIVVLAAIEKRTDNRLLPQGALSLSTPLGTVLATILLFGISITSDIFAPLFLQKLHGLSPLWAGYLTALVAAGWTIAAVATSGWTGARARIVIVAAPIAMTLSVAGLAVFLATDNTSGGLPGIVLASACLLALGLGIGIAFQQFSTRALAASSLADNDRVSATLGMVQLFASGIGAAIGGVVVNAAGLPAATTTAGVESAARTLYVVLAVLTALAIPLALRVVSTIPHPVRQPAE